MMRAFLLSLLLLPPGAARAADPVETNFKAADVLLDKGEYAQARASLDEALAGLKTEDPRLVRYHERTGAAWLREGKTVEAHASFAAALKATQRLKVAGDPGAKAYAGMGLCLRREKRDTYALRFFQKALTFKLDESTRMLAKDQIREIEGAAAQPAR